MAKPGTPTWTPAAVGAANCLGYYLLNENSGTTANDLSGNASHGTLAGTTSWVSGAYGPAVRQGDVAAGLDTPVSLEGRAAWTVALLFTQGATSGFDGVYGRLIDDLGTVSLVNEGAANLQTLSINFGSVYTGADLGIAAGGTYALVVSYDGTTVRTVVNGALVRSDALAGAVSGSASTLTFGNRPDHIRGVEFDLHWAGAYGAGYSEADAIALSNDLLAGTFAAAGGASDTTPPTAGTWATNAAGTQVGGKLSELGCVPASGTGGFSLAGTTATPNGFTISGDDIVITLTGSIAYGETVVIGYDRTATTDDIADAAGNFLDDFTAASVTNNVPAPPLVAGVASFGAASYSGPGGIKVQATPPTDGTGAGPTYQWERNEDGGAWADLAGATTLNPLDATATTPGVLYGYRLKQTRGSETVTTNAITAEVYEGGAIGGPPPGEIDDVTADELRTNIKADTAAIVGHIAATNVALPSGVTMGDFDPETDALRSQNAAGEASHTELDAAIAALNTAIAAVNTLATAIKGKTDNLPASPANEATSTAIKAKTDLIPASPAATSDIPAADIAAIKAKTDTLPTFPTRFSSLAIDTSGYVTATNGGGGSTAAYSSTLATVTSTGGTLNSPPSYSLADYTVTVGGRSYEVASHTAGAAAFTLRQAWKATPSVGATIEAEYYPDRLESLKAIALPMRRLDTLSSANAADGLSAAVANVAGDKVLDADAKTLTVKHADGSIAAVKNLDSGTNPTSAT